MPRLEAAFPASPSVRLTQRTALLLEHDRYIIT
jgi:hypothetical protein